MIKAIVTDIEGTTSSLSFVKDVLFPYAREHLADFIAQQGNEPQVRQLLNEAKQEAGDASMSDETIVQQFIQWIDEDKKVTPLKSLQGLIWEQGYRQGDYTGHMYADAVEYLRQWHDQGIRLYVYSSGSVYAQKLLFGHTDYGDLTHLFTDYFDTHIGHKREADAYRAIGKSTGIPCVDILFLSDIKEELDAARETGMRTYWLVRDGTLSIDSKHPQAKDFSEIPVNL